MRENITALLPLLLVIAVCVGGALFIWRQSKAKGRWGIDLSKLFGAKCPRCGTKTPPVRMPTSLNEALWGGWTCRNCGAKIDKYGRERVS